MDVKKKNRNASAAAFGWRFQVNAALVLFIKNIENAVSVRVEGKNQDIEIKLIDDSYIYGQAKARATNDPGYRSAHRFKEAMPTLMDNYKEGNSSLLYYVTNDEFPFGKTYKYAMFGDDSLYSYRELPTDLQSFVKDVAYENGFEEGNLDQFFVCVIGFYGDDSSTRLRIVRRYIEKLIADLGIQNKGRINFDLLRNIWGTMLEENSSELDLDITIEKEKFVWPIIVNVCNASEDDSYFEQEDDDFAQDVIAQYNEIINSSNQRFSFVTKVMSDFSDYKATYAEGNRRTIKESFGDAYWGRYRDELGLADLDEEVAEVLIKLILRKIICRSSIIQNIKGGVGL